MLLEDKVAIVSGVGPGMGRDISLSFAREGADVVLAARSRERLEAVADEVRARGRRAVCVPTDITQPDACAALVEAAIEAFGHLDVLVNNAFRQPPFETLEQASERHFREAFDINFFGHAWLTKAAIPHLRAAAPSSIVFINTMSAHRYRENFGIYTAAKLALLGMAKVLAVELGPSRVRVNSVHPGYIWGDSVKWFFEKQAAQRGITYDEVYAETAGQTALHHLPGSDEIAQAVVFLASEKMSSSITGESIDVNAGMWIR
ncbi:MAG TPA: SDR family oxidoreductase [Acidimicrobiales bacterium]|jgi:NAD(P)-dependent dehydrogenase (short-subunit alcohol dehydrogenase family)|nr:SDR family oxidoreductase [Acidimicrobiales bacterium]